MKLKILIINRHREDSLGGSELQCDFIAEELINRGYEVKYLAMMGSEKKYDTSYKVIPCNSDANSIIENIKKLRPEVIYWRYNKRHLFPVARYARKNMIKFIFSASHIIDLKPWLFNKKIRIHNKLRILIDRLWQHRGFKYIDALVVNNKNFLNVLSVPNQVFIPNGMTGKSVPFYWEKPYITWVANIKEVKRPELYIELAKELESSGVDFLMVGAIQEKRYSWIQDKEYQPSNLHYLGPKSVEEVNGILASSLMHVHTCYVEGFPNIFIQAWMQGIPSITYSFDPSDYMKENNLGYSANEKRQDFIRLVKKFIEDPEEREIQGMNAKKFAEDTFQIDKSVSKLEEVISSIN